MKCETKNELIGKNYKFVDDLLSIIKNVEGIRILYKFIPPLFTRLGDVVYKDALLDLLKFNDIDTPNQEFYEHTLSDAEKEVYNFHGNIVIIFAFRKGFSKQKIDFEITEEFHKNYNPVIYAIELDDNSKLQIVNNIIEKIKNFDNTKFE